MKQKKEGEKYYLADLVLGEGVWGQEAFSGGRGGEIDDEESFVLVFVSLLCFMMNVMLLTFSL